MTHAVESAARSQFRVRLSGWLSPDDAIGSCCPSHSQFTTDVGKLISVGVHYAEATRRSRRGWVTGAFGVLVLVGALVGAVVVDAERIPSSDGLAAKLAEWGRDHGLGAEVTWLETLQYAAHQPAIGGAPAGGIQTPAGAIAHPAASETFPSNPLAPLAGGAPLPGEGVWHTVINVKGRPAVQVSQLRPDDQHTSFLAGIMRMDPTLISGQLRPGTRDPGGSWREASSLTAAELPRTAAVFNGGFRLSEPHDGGYYSDGRTVSPLIDGEASLVLHTDGTADVGAWNRDVRMAPTIASVRQNLVMLVDDGQVNPTCANGGSREWGKTVGQVAYIDRSGFGVTATGAEVYVAGPALSVCTLGRLLQDAGVVRGMELDINPAWVSGAYFHAGPDARPVGSRLFPAERLASDHYLRPSSRDWFAWFVRS
jgi:hypothetical protein